MKNRLAAVLFLSLGLLFFGCTKQNPIIGKWKKTVVSEYDDPLTVEFVKEGTVIGTKTNGTSVGTWAWIDNNRIKIQLDTERDRARGPEVFSVIFSGDEMQILERNNVVTFKRIH